MILNEEHAENVIEVKRVLKLEINGVMKNNVMSHKLAVRCKRKRNSGVS